MILVYHNISSGSNSQKLVAIIIYHERSESSSEGVRNIVLVEDIRISSKKPL